MHTILILAAVYGTLVGGNLVNAPANVNWEGANHVTSFLPENAANAIGYKLVVDERPACASNEYAVAIGWVLSGFPERIHRTYEKRIIVPPPRKFSKLKIYGAIISLPDANGTSAWAKVQSWLEAKTIGGVNGWMAFQLAQEISEDHALFAPLAEEARVLLGLTAEQFETLLNSCILEG